MPILVTGSAGFIGNHVALRLLEQGEDVVGLDNLNDYYDPNLKRRRLERLASHRGYRDTRIDLADKAGLSDLFERHRPERVIHLAAQAGVRHSLENPDIYIQSNIIGFQHLLDCCIAQRIAHLVFASTSSVYGANTERPYKVEMGTAHPLSLYAATKRSNELVAHAYAHLHGMPVTGLRFFTVYGPWGRPDMALFKFTEAMLKGEAIDIYNNGEMTRDFTYVDDIAAAVVAVSGHAPAADPAWDGDAPNPAASAVAPFRLYNVGANKPTSLLRYIEVLEDCLGLKAKRNYLPMQPGDVAETWADCEDLIALTGQRPETSVEDGVKRFVDWYRDYYGKPSN